MKEKSLSVLEQFRLILGSKFVITDKKKMRPFTKGWRLGGGPAMAVLRPGTLLEMWNILKICVGSDLAILVQATNTGLTGGSTPLASGYDRYLVIINTLRINDIHIIKEAKQFVAFAGATLFELEDCLNERGREPHSVLGSSCIGASIIGGVCNNSGGALLQRGPAYTELALFAYVDTTGELKLVNELNIDLGKNPEEILQNLQKKNYTPSSVTETDRLASDHFYQNRVRDVDADTPARFNHNSERLYGASGCAGKIAVFAVRIDSYRKPKSKKVFYVGTNETDLLETMRREILTRFQNLPVSGEYIHRHVYDVTKKFGRDNFFIIEKFGSRYIPKLFNLKNLIDRWLTNLPFLSENSFERLMQLVSNLLPNHLPKRMENFRDKFEHHWIVEMADDGIEEAREYLKNFFSRSKGEFFECSKVEGEKAMLHRFLAAGAISRYHICKGKNSGEMISLDFALRRNDREWFTNAIDDNNNLIMDKFCYGHFFCHVLHQNYILVKGADPEKVKKIILNDLEKRGAEYPAEHNVGCEYQAKENLLAHYKRLDPTNSFNPGVGQTSKNKDWSN